MRVHTLSERPRPRQELICLSRMRRRDMAILFNSGVGSCINDWVQLVSMPTTRSSAVLRCRVRIGGRLEVFEFALLRATSEELRCGETKSNNNMSARPRTNHRERPGHVSAIHINSRAAAKNRDTWAVWDEKQAHSKIKSKAHPTSPAIGPKCIVSVFGPIKPRYTRVCLLCLTYNCFWSFLSQSEALHSSTLCPPYEC